MSWHSKQYSGTLINSIQLKCTHVGLGGLGVTRSSQDPSFAGSKPAEVAGFFQDVKILSTSPPEGTLKLEVPILRFQAR